MQGQWIAARDLTITWVNNPQFWTWKTVDPNIEVAELRSINWLDIYGKIETKNLIQTTSYAVYLVFKLTDNPRGLERSIASLRFVKEVAKDAGIEGTTVFISKKKELPGELGRFPHLRSDGWLEIKLGEFFNNLGEDGEVEMRLMEINNATSKSGIIVKGFDIRRN
ncbi:F-box protein PP2-B11-like [Nicotiana tomentosiformis]|uniref:F-box protein PP2-B11-like n=1 Tax=Nicotiana tomentosiformis TaxID=4098 RepID=UPI00388CA208